MTAGLVGALLLGGSPLAHASHVLSMSPDSGPPGSIVRIAGQSQYANQPCTVRFAGNTVPVRDGTCATDGNGAVDERFNVPSVARDASYDVEFWAGEGEFAVLEDEFYFYVPPPPAFSVSPTQGPPGTTVRVSGSDFAAPCAIHFDQDQQVGPTECDVTGNGTIDETFTIPSSAAVGDHSVRACARCGRSGEEWARVSFHVTEPPATEEPTSDQPTSEPPLPSDEPETPRPSITTDIEPSEQPTRPERSPLNRGPRAVDDSATTDVGAVVRIDVVANDRDPDGRLNLRSVRLTSRPRHGTAHLDGHIVVYEPYAEFVGDDLFTYRVCDDGGACDSARISITVTDPATHTSDEDDTTTPSEPDECRPFRIRNLTINPASGRVGTTVRITVDADVVGEDCLPGPLRLTLNGEPLGDPLDVEGDGVSFDWIVPGGLPVGSHSIAVDDGTGSRAVADAPFELLASSSTPIPRSAMLPALAALLVGGTSAGAIARRRRRRMHEADEVYERLEGAAANARQRVEEARERADEALEDARGRSHALMDCRRRQQRTNHPPAGTGESHALKDPYVLLGHVSVPIRDEPVRGIVVRVASPSVPAAEHAADRFRRLQMPAGHVVIGPDTSVPLLPDHHVVPDDLGGRAGGKVFEVESETGDVRFGDGSRGQSLPDGDRGVRGTYSRGSRKAGEIDTRLSSDTLTVVVVGLGNDPRVDERILERTAAWCHQRIERYGIPARHVNLTAGRHNGLIGQWEVTETGAEGSAEFPWNRLLDLIGSSGQQGVGTQGPADPCIEIQQAAEEARQRAAEAEDEVEQAQRELQDVETQLADAHQKVTDTETSSLATGDALLDGAEPPHDSDGR